MYLWYMGKKVKREALLMELIKRNERERRKEKLKEEL